VNSPLPSATKVGKALAQARREFKQFGSGSLEAQVLLAHLLDRPRDWILAHPEADLPQALFLQYLALIRRAAAGEPLAYLTGSREFFGLDFFTTPDALIPRPETELLAETALQWLADRRKINPSSLNPICAVDVGTGCGCIAATLAFREPGLRVLASDISFRALALAARNLAAHGVSNRVRLVQTDLLAPFRGPIDLLCANLPYIPAAALAALPVARYEPRIALDGGPDGLRLIARALEQTALLLAEGGMALFEIEASQGKAARDMAAKYFPRAKLAIEKDLSGKDRLLHIAT
jgi:release factor glutamine methyltransferase